MLAEGQALPPLAVTDLYGHASVIDYRSDRRQTMIYVLSASCIWCQRNSPSFHSLSKMRQNLRIVGVSTSLEGMAGFIARTGFEFPVYQATESAAEKYRLAQTPTPTTILVSAEATVVKIWTGAYVGHTKTSIEDYFKIVLPSD